MAEYMALGLVFANRQDDRLPEMTARRAIASVPVGAQYRLIDFTLSNLVNAGISRIGILTYTECQSLQEHVGTGRAWNLAHKNDALYFLPSDAETRELYNGRIMPLAGIRSMLRHAKEKYVVLCDSHLVGSYDLTDMLRRHEEEGNTFTLLCKRAGAYRQRAEAVVLCEKDSDAIHTVALNTVPSEDSLVWLGVAVATRTVLLRLVEKCMSLGQINFEKDILQQYASAYPMGCYETKDWIIPITSLDAYYQANMALLDPDVRDEVFHPDRPIYTQYFDSPPARIEADAQVTDSLIADGSRIDGQVEHSLIFPNVTVEKNAVVKNSIIMSGTLIHADALLDCVIADKQVSVSDGRCLKSHSLYPLYIAKNSVV